MINKTVIACATAAILTGFCCTTLLANAENFSKALPIHWGKHPYSNLGNIFENGKNFCRKKYFGKKTCIPGMNATQDVLTFSTASYNSDDAPSNNVIVLMGKQSLPLVTFTVRDTTADGKSSVVYSGPANNREGIVCVQDKAKAVTCNPWK